MKPIHREYALVLSTYCIRVSRLGFDRTESLFIGECARVFIGSSSPFLTHPKKVVH